MLGTLLSNVDIPRVKILGRTAIDCSEFEFFRAVLCWELMIVHFFPVYAIPLTNVETFFRGAGQANDIGMFINLSRFIDSELNFCSQE